MTATNPQHPPRIIEVDEDAREALSMWASAMEELLDRSNPQDLFDSTEECEAFISLSAQLIQAAGLTNAFGSSGRFIYLDTKGWTGP